MMMLTLLAAAIAAPSLADDYAAVAVGRFSSQAQHRADASYDWAEARVIRIWPDRTDGIWLYHEQAIISVAGLTPDQARARPYFQFVARINSLAPGVLRRENFRLKDPAAWRGLQAGDARLATLSPTDLGAASCHNRLDVVSRSTFIGRTESCANNWRGAVRLDSVSITSPDAYVNWDRGFDAAGNRVWGPANGGYEFRRVAP
jgi:hypothetical protein